MKKLLLSLSVFAFLAGSMVAQENVVKASLTNIATGTVTLGYERTFAEKFSANLYLGLVVPRELPEFFLDETNDGEEINIGSRLSGFNITPEFRIYPGRKGAPRGFYLAPYLRHNNYSVDLGSYTEDGETYTATGKYVTFGGGLQLGCQWLIADMVSIEWYFMTIGYNTGNIKLNFEGEDGSIEDPEGLEDDLEADFGEIPWYGKKVKVDVTDSEAKVKLPIGMLAYRFGLSIGFAF